MLDLKPVSETKKLSDILYSAKSSLDLLFSGSNFKRSNLSSNRQQLTIDSLEKAKFDADVTMHSGQFCSLIDRNFFYDRYDRTFIVSLNQS